MQKEESIEEANSPVLGIRSDVLKLWLPYETDYFRFKSTKTRASDVTPLQLD